MKAAPEVDVTTELSAGNAAEQLIGRSASAGLLVLGSHGRGGFSGLLAGSTAVGTHGTATLCLWPLRPPPPTTER